MKINHIAIYTNNLEQMKDFYEFYFHAVANREYHNEKTGLRTYFVSFENDTRLELMSRPGLIPNSNSPYHLGYIHMAFSLGTKEAVDETTDLLEKDGYTILSKPRTTGDGYYESCILDPDGNQIELVV